MEGHGTIPARKERNHKSKPVIKRLMANKCERERVRKINEAFEVLKTHIPYCDSGRIRTKLDVLKFAIDYIQILSKMVSQNEAAMLLRASQLNKGGQGFDSVDLSPIKSDEIYGVEQFTFPFNEHQSLTEVSSPTSSDEEIFFMGGLNEEKIQDQFQWNTEREQAHKDYRQQQEREQQEQEREQQQQQEQRQQRQQQQQREQQQQQQREQQNHHPQQQQQNHHQQQQNDHSQQQQNDHPQQQQNDHPQQNHQQQQNHDQQQQPQRQHQHQQQEEPCIDEQRWQQFNSLLCSETKNGWIIL